MKIYSLILLSAYLVTTGYAAGGMDTGSITEEEAADSFNCLCVISCDYNYTYELERIAIKTGPLLRQKAMGSYGECYGRKNIGYQELLDNWKKIVCPNPIEVKRQCFMAVMNVFALFMEEKCKTLSASEECIKAQEAMVEGKTVIREYQQNGICYNPETMKEEMEKDGAYKVTGHHFDEPPKPPNFR